MDPRMQLGGSSQRLGFDPSVLSLREEEFLRLVCHPDEHTYKVIADRMGVHPRTVDGYREAIFHRFGIKSKVGLVLFAIKRGIVHP